MLAAIVAAGLASRLAHTGFPLLDKYLGDVLYAAMVYVLVRLAAPGVRAWWWAAGAMLAVECFQLTLIPARMLASPSLPVRLCARLLGTQFSVWDLLAYALGIAGLAALECWTRARRA